MSSITSL